MNAQEAKDGAQAMMKLVETVERWLSAPEMRGYKLLEVKIADERRRVTAGERVDVSAVRQMAARETMERVFVRKLRERIERELAFAGENSLQQQPVDGGTAAEHQICS